MYSRRQPPQKDHTRRMPSCVCMFCVCVCMRLTWMSRRCAMRWISLSNPGIRLSTAWRAQHRRAPKIGQRVHWMWSAGTHRGVGPPPPACMKGRPRGRRASSTRGARRGAYRPLSSAMLKHLRAGVRAAPARPAAAPAHARCGARGSPALWQACGSSKPGACTPCRGFSLLCRCLQVSVRACMCMCKCGHTRKVNIEAAGGARSEK